MSVIFCTIELINPQRNKSSTHHLINSLAPHHRMENQLKIVYLSIYAHENGKVFNANVRFLGGVYDTYAPKENGEKEEEQYSLF